MRAITKDMSVKEARLWIHEKKKRINSMPSDELNEFNQELKSINEEWSNRWEVRLFKVFDNIFVLIGVVLIVLGGLSFHLMN